MRSYHTTQKSVQLKTYALFLEFSINIAKLGQEIYSSVIECMPSMLKVLGLIPSTIILINLF
jgi:hypothetical protein